MKLNEKKVKVIQQLFQFEEMGDSDIATLFNVSRETINSIRHGHRWNSVTGIKQERKKSNDYRDFGRTKEEEIIKQIKEQLLNHLSNFQ